MHPSFLDQLARVRAAESERAIRHVAVHAHALEPAPPRLRRAFGNAVVALGHRLGAEVAAPQPRGVPPG